MPLVEEDGVGGIVDRLFTMSERKKEKNLFFSKIIKNKQTKKTYIHTHTHTQKKKKKNRARNFGDPDNGQKAGRKYTGRLHAARQLGGVLEDNVG